MKSVGSTRRSESSPLLPGDFCSCGTGSPLSELRWWAGRPQASTGQESGHDGCLDHDGNFLARRILFAEHPAILVGGSVDLRFDMPGACFDPDCDFTICVDSKNR